MSRQFNLERIFTHHPPFGDQQERYTAIRNVAKDFGAMLEDFCKPSRELSTALTNLQAVVMWANAAIAINEVAPVAPVAEEVPVGQEEEQIAGAAEVVTA